MRDSEIIKALECCKKTICVDCPNLRKGKGMFWCKEELQSEALDLINSQKAEIERLSDRNHKCIYLSDNEATEYCVEGPCPEFKTEAQIKAEAIKEFAERVVGQLEENYSCDVGTLKMIALDKAIAIVKGVQNGK